MDSWMCNYPGMASWTIHTLFSVKGRHSSGWRRTTCINGERTKDFLSTQMRKLEVESSRKLGLLTSLLSRQGCCLKCHRWFRTAADRKDLSVCPLVTKRGLGSGECQTSQPSGWGLPENLEALQEMFLLRPSSLQLYGNIIIDQQ